MNASKRELLWVTGLFTALTLVFTWPVVTHLGSEVPTGDLEIDVIHLLYGVSWGTHALATQPLHYFDANIFHPYTNALAFMEHMFGIAVLAAPVNWITGNFMAGYSVAWLLTFILSGLGAYLLTRYLTGSVAAGLLAGVIFAFSPFRYHNAGLINVLATMWIPFALLSLHLWVQTRSRAQLVLLWGFAVGQFLCSGYAAVFLLFSVFVYVAVWAVMAWRELLAFLRQELWALLAAVVAGVLVALPFVLPYLGHAGDDVGFQRDLIEATYYSAHPLDFITPGGFLGALVPWAGSALHPLFPGLVAVLLASVWCIRSRRARVKNRELWFCLALGLVAAVMTLGPEKNGVPLPFTLVWHGFPGGSFVRAPVRFAVLTSLAISVLAGAGLAHVLKGTTRRQAWSALAVLAACVELLHVPVRVFNPLPHGVPAVYTWLGSLSGPVVVTEYPMPASEAEEAPEYGRAMLYALHHKKQLTDGSAAFVPPITRDLRTAMQGFPDDASVARLRDVGTTYVLVHTELLSPDESARIRQAAEAQPALRWVEREGPVWVVEVIPGG